MDAILDNLIKRFPALKDCVQDIQSSFQILADCYHNDLKVLLCGNGGSAADAEHWSGELLKSFVAQRKLDACWNGIMPQELVASLQKALPAIPLTGFISAMTAFNNDVNPNFTFAQLVWALGKKGDVLIGISTSGDAKNVCYTADVAKAKGMPVIALTGKTGGTLAKKATVAIRVPETETWRIQELHLPIYHCICLMLEKEFFG